mmetsp:Transcript_3588/g.10579  ORF Transcript_3588/g.10579 Transcript_3588/m.10579 type:complete len:345 (-) Transcript_3588:554-1588(-)
MRGQSSALTRTRRKAHDTSLMAIKRRDTGYSICMATIWRTIHWRVGRTTGGNQYFDVPPFTDSAFDGASQRFDVTGSDWWCTGLILSGKVRPNSSRFSTPTIRCSKTLSRSNTSGVLSAFGGRKVSAPSGVCESPRAANEFWGSNPALAMSHSSGLSVSILSWDGRSRSRPSVKSSQRPFHSRTRWVGMVTMGSLHFRLRLMPSRHCRSAPRVATTWVQCNSPVLRVSRCTSRSATFIGGPTFSSYATLWALMAFSSEPHARTRKEHARRPACIQAGSGSSGAVRWRVTRCTASCLTSGFSISRRPLPGSASGGPSGAGRWVSPLALQLAPGALERTTAMTFPS